MKITTMVYAAITGLIVTLIAIGSSQRPMDREPSDDGLRERLAEYVKENAHDPDSIEILYISPGIRGENAWAVSHDVKWRGRNAFGGLVLVEDRVLYDKYTPGYLVIDSVSPLFPITADCISAVDSSSQARH